MNMLYLAIVLLTVYGDLLKRYLPGPIAVASLYILALAILIWMIISNLEGRKIKSPLYFEEKQIINCIYSLIGVYAFELSIASLNNAPLIAGLSTTIYVLLPLGYTVVIIKYYPHFNGIILAQLYHLAMIPINIIGLIQFRIDPSFLINNSYVETGGIIYRNLLESGSFSRFPSIFVSADRYSSIGLIQLYLAFLLLLENKPESKYKIYWILFNMLSGFTALLISGARSRLLIAAILFILLGLTILTSFLSNDRFKIKYLFKGTSALLLFVICISLIIAIASPEKFSSLGQEINSLPIVGFLQESLTNDGDAQSRVDQAIQTSLIPEDVTLFGEGLGTLGEKPREFGISAIWIESGLFGGLAKLIAFAGIILTFGLLAIKSFIRQQPVYVVLFITPALVIGFGLLTGITGALELSSGVLLCVCMGFIINFSRQNRLQ